MRDRSGFAFVTVLAIMVITFTLAMAYVAQVRSELNIATNLRDGIKAFYAAEAGKEATLAILTHSLELALYGIFMPMDDDPEDGFGPFRWEGGAESNVFGEPVAGQTDTYRFRSVGWVNAPAMEGASSRATRTVDIDVVFQFPFGYALMTGSGSTVDFRRGQVTVQGDIMAGGEVLIGSGGRVGKTGAIQSGLSGIALPGPVWPQLTYPQTYPNHFKNDIHRIPGDFNFLLPGRCFVTGTADRWQGGPIRGPLDCLYYGVWVVDGNVRVSQPGTSRMQVGIIQGNVTVDMPGGRLFWGSQQGEDFNPPSGVILPSLVMQGDLNLTRAQEVVFDFPVFVGGKVTVGPGVKATFHGGLIAKNGIELQGGSQLSLRDQRAFPIVGFKYIVEKALVREDLYPFPYKVHVVNWRTVPTGVNPYP